MAEEVLGAGKKWHKRCFTCRSCGKGLDSSTLGEHDGEIFCKTCHSKSFGPTGFGYGVGAGTLRNTSTIAEQFADKAAPAPGPSTETFARPQPAAASSSVTAAAAPSTAGAPKPTGPDICPRCGKKAYMAERVLAVGRSWHKTCFTCRNCGKGVESTTITEREGEIYCKACYAKNFGPK